jgi:hypothetical protein
LLIKKLDFKGLKRNIQDMGEKINIIWCF